MSDDCHVDLLGNVHQDINERVRSDLETQREVAYSSGRFAFIRDESAKTNPHINHGQDYIRAFHWQAGWMDAMWATVKNPEAMRRIDRVAAGERAASEERLNPGAHQRGRALDVG